MMAPTLRSLGNTRLAMLNTPRALTTREEFAADIKREWTNALESTVAVGRRLNEAKAALPHGEFQAMIETDLPFGAATARKLREVAEFVDAGKVPLEQLPESYSTLYAIATMPDETRRHALDDGVIRPDVTRAELVAYKAPKPAEARRGAVNPGLDDLFDGAGAVQAAASEPPAPVSTNVTSYVDVPDPLLIRLTAALHERGLVGPDVITLQHPDADEQLELRKSGYSYEIAIHRIKGCGYVWSCMAKTKVADFLRKWLNADVRAEPAAAAPVIDVAPVAAALPTPDAAPPAVGKPGWIAEALTRPWSALPEDSGAIAVRLASGTVMTVLIVVPYDPDYSTADTEIVEHVVNLHNAKLLAG